MPAGDPGRSSSLSASPYDLLQGLPSACVLGAWPLAAHHVGRSAGLLALPPARPLGTRSDDCRSHLNAAGGARLPIFQWMCITGRVRASPDERGNGNEEIVHGMRYVASILCCTLYLRPRALYMQVPNVRPQAEPNEGREALKGPRADQRASCEQFMLDGDMTSRRRFASAAALQAL